MPSTANTSSSDLSMHDVLDGSFEMDWTPQRDTTYPSGFEFAVIMFALCLSVFCVAWDNTIIATAIPHITDEFQDTQVLDWYGFAYLLTTCAFPLFYGKLYSYYEVRKIFFTALSIFVIGSIVCATSPNSLAFTFGRLIVGLGAAGIYSGSLIIIAHSSPIYKRPAYTGMVGSMYGLASVVGPAIEGAITDGSIWRRSLSINAILGAWSGFIVVIVALFLKSKAQTRHPYREGGFLRSIWQFDLISNSFFVPCIVCLLLALQRGGKAYAWSYDTVGVLWIVFGIILIFFLFTQAIFREEALVPWHIMSQRTIFFSSLLSVLLGAAFFLSTYFLPVWFQAIKGISIIQSGIDSIPLTLSITVGVLFSGCMTTKFGFYMPYVYAGVVLASIGAGLLTTLAPNTDTGKWIVYQIIFGLGVGLAFQIPQIAAQTLLPLKDVAQGVSITVFAETLGGAIFVLAGNNLLDDQLVKYIGALNIPSVDPNVLVRLDATQLRSYVPQEFLEQIVEAYNYALVNTLHLAIIVACLTALAALGMEWRSVHTPAVEAEA